jgi:peptide/nickel transport system permease protein
LLIFVIVAGIFGLIAIPSSIVGTVNLPARLEPLSSNHPLGTDIFGRDILKMIVLAIPYDITIALIVVLISSSVGLMVGIFAGFRGGLFEEAVMRFTDIFFSFPALILALAVGSVIGRSYLGLIVTLLIVDWTIYVRLARGQVVAEKQKPYVTALRKLGISRRRIIFRHLIRNTMFPIVVTAALDLANIILLIAGLSFPWPVVFPGIAIVITALSFNLIGDGLRDALDPRLGLRR